MDVINLEFVAQSKSRDGNIGSVEESDCAEDKEPDDEKASDLSWTCIAHRILMRLGLFCRLIPLLPQLD